MKYRYKALVAAFLLLGVLLTGCGGVVGEIAGNVADVAVKELEV